MKSKKLFAVMTLVMFMMTLLPMVAFGAPPTLTATTVTFAAANASTATAAGIDLAEAAFGEIPLGNIVLTAPTGVTFDTTATITLAHTGAGFVGTVPTVANGNLTATTITIPVTTASTTLGTLTIGGVKLLTSETTTGNTFLVTISGGGLAAAATAITATTAYQSNRYASAFDLAGGDDVAVADGIDYIESVVYISNGTPQPGQKVLIVTNRGAIDTHTTANATNYPLVPPVTGYVTTGTGDYQGKAVIRTTSTTKGEDIKLAVAVPYLSYAPAVPTGMGAITSEALHVDAIRAYLNGSTAYTVEQLNIIDVKDITFESPAAGAVAITNSGATIADGLTEMSVYVTVTNGGTPIAGEEVTFSVNKTGLYFNKTSYTTDAMGKVTAKVTATKAGTYDIKATAGGKNNTTTATFIPSTTGYNLEFTKEPDGPIAKGIASEKFIKIKVSDINGNKISTGTPITTVDIKSKPSGSNASDPVLNATSATDGNGYFQYDFTPDKEGTYVLRFALVNGKCVETTVESQKQGEITEITVSYTAKSLTIASTVGGSTVAAPTVKQLDANGVSSPATGSLQFSSSDPSVASVVAGTGVITNATTDTKKAKVVTITVVDTSNNLVATTEMPVVGIPVSVAATEVGTADVNEKASVTLTLKDANGNTVALGATPTLAYSITSKPAGAGVDVSYAATAGTDFKNKGIATANVTSTVAGTVEVVFRITDGTTMYTVPVSFDIATEKVVVGSNSVTMFIGATGFVQDGVAKVTDVAPFIQDSRTFVAVRPVADAFGAEIGWDEATQTVTLTRDDMTLTIVIGSNVITKVADGVTTTSEADVAAFIKDGRTVLPFRAVGEAFGATVEYDAATQAVSFTQ